MRPSPQIVRTIDAFMKLRSTLPGKVGFVPTMGYLHEGHGSLMKHARTENKHVVASIFVNPTQFAPTDDLAAYPRDLDRDMKVAQGEGVDYLFLPDAADMYPGGWGVSGHHGGSRVEVEGIKGKEAVARPGHFSGVATVLTKLFNIVQPHRAYFGQKDMLQCVVVKKMVRDLNFPLDVVVCPTLREANGLAMSSRNSYLAPGERLKAGIIYEALQSTQRLYQTGERDCEVLRGHIGDILSREPLLSMDYVSIADGMDGGEISGKIDGARGANISLAVFLNGVHRRTRLIDNIDLPGV
eukprot:TRINITY_DN6707_c0_g1_i1.p1 TRINITY_DN6707_c0_g1~~TRINITY_DN6707_c0_g1_i1.p1  ORF type:complete len:297 (+),score=54.73 TRINITY_DN6707_c0_g1_i1:25-915(+)